jgi:BlaI family penicillinase repressor
MSDVVDNPVPRRSSRHAILDLAPLELDCMTAIWSLGSGTVREIQDKLMATRPRAYTTLMTIMDRLAQKGIVSRQRVGRAYRYEANLSSDEARRNAVGKVVAGFFDGSTEALASHLASHAHPDQSSASIAIGSEESRTASQPVGSRPSRPAAISSTDNLPAESASTALDSSLL